MNEVKQYLTILDTLLRQEIDLYQQLLCCQREEKRFLIERVLPAFTKNLQIKEGIAWKIAKLEKERKQVVEHLAALWHLPPEELTLNHLSARIEEPYATQLLHHRSVLQTLVHDLQTVDRENEILLREALIFLEAALAFFERVSPHHSIYHQSGKFVPQPHGRVISGRV